MAMQRCLGKGRSKKDGPTEQLDSFGGGSLFSGRAKNNSFKYFNTSPEIIRLAVVCSQTMRKSHASFQAKAKITDIRHSFLSPHHFNQERHLYLSQSFKINRTADLNE